MEVKALNWKHLNAWLGSFIWKTRPVSNKNRAWSLSPMRLLGKQSSSDSAVRVIALAIPCIIELLAQPGPARRGTVVCLCPRDHEAHSIMKKPLSQWTRRRRTLSLTSIQLRPSLGYCTPAQVAFQSRGNGAVSGECLSRRKPFAVQHPVQLSSLLKIHPHTQSASSHSDMQGCLFQSHMSLL